MMVGEHVQRMMSPFQNPTAESLPLPLLPASFHYRPIPGTHLSRVPTCSDLPASVVTFTSKVLRVLWMGVCLGGSTNKEILF